MKPLRARLRDVANRTRVSQMVVEKDYALSYLLAGIAAKPELSETLIFKGGTALKKLYCGVAARVVAPRTRRSRR